MSTILEVPAEIEGRRRHDLPDLDRKTKIALGLELFREERISIFELRQLLGFSRSEVNQFLIDRDEWAQCLTLDDLAQESRLSTSVGRP